MSCPFSKESLAQLKAFVDFCKSKPDILNIPELIFVKEFIEGFGGKIPEPKEMPQETKIPEQEPKQEVEVESEPESELEFDMEGCIEPDEIDPNQSLAEPDKEISEEDADKADELRRQAQLQFSEGNFDKALELYVEAIKINPSSALLFAKRGQVYLKLNKPNACIKDCTQALELNPDSAAAYKFRGRAYRLIAEWEKAAQDLRTACKIDFDEQTDEWLKEVTPNAVKIEQHNLKKERKKADKEEKERLERIRKAKEAHAKAAKAETEEHTEATGGGPGGMGNFYKLFQDPEVMAAFKDPEVAAAFQDISQDPANFIKYQNNPKIRSMLEKLSKKFEGSGMNFGNPSDWAPPSFTPNFPTSGQTNAGPTIDDDGLD